jgi:hypothetical protein
MRLFKHLKSLLPTPTIMDDEPQFQSEFHPDVSSDEDGSSPDQ